MYLVEPLFGAVRDDEPLSEFVDDVWGENKMAPEKSLVFVQNSVNDAVFQRHGFTLWIQTLPARAESPALDEKLLDIWRLTEA